MNEYITIKLTQGQVALVDEQDSDLLSLKWYAAFDKTYGQGGAYMAQRGVNRDGKVVITKMHRLILSRILGRELFSNEFCDHINNNPLDNRRGNLRLASAYQNSLNTRLRSNNKTGFKGVHYASDRGKWRACIRVNKKTLNLGQFDTPEEAHRAYCEAAKEHYGEFARLE